MAAHRAIRPRTMLPASASLSPQAERTLLSFRPTRLIALRWWSLLVLSLVLATVFWFGVLHPWLKEYAVYGTWTTDRLLTALFLFLAFVAFVIAELRRRTTRYIITDNKIIRVDGILNKNTQMIPYTQLERLDLRQSLGQRILGIGTLVVDTGDDTLDLEMIPHPKRVQALLTERLGRRAWIPQR